MKCIIVEDEPLAAKVIEKYLSEIDGIQLTAKCANAVEAFNVLKKEKVDLIFLDIKMPKISGFDFLRSLNYQPKVIVTTAYRDYALESYEYEITDYLLKPISFERFLKAINKAVKSELPAESRASKSTVTESEDANGFIFVKSEKKMIKVWLKEIVYVEGLKDYIRIITTKENIICNLSLNYLEKKIPLKKFIRIHRSYIVSLEHIKSYTPTEIQIQNKFLPIGRFYKRSVINLLGVGTL